MSLQNICTRHVCGTHDSCFVIVSSTSCVCNVLFYTTNVSVVAACCRCYKRKPRAVHLTKYNFVCPFILLQHCQKPCDGMMCFVWEMISNCCVVHLILHIVCHYHSHAHRVLPRWVCSALITTSLPTSKLINQPNISISLALFSWHYLLPSFSRYDCRYVWHVSSWPLIPKCLLLKERDTSCKMWPLSFIGDFNVGTPLQIIMQWVAFIIL